MLCFRDRTFCNDKTCNGACGFEVWTPELQAAADRWWRTFKVPDHPAPVAFIIHDEPRHRWPEVQGLNPEPLVCPTCGGEGDTCRDPFHDDEAMLRDKLERYGKSLQLVEDDLLLRGGCMADWGPGEEEAWDALSQEERKAKATENLRSLFGGREYSDRIDGDLGFDRSSEK